MIQRWEVNEYGDYPLGYGDWCKDEDVAALEAEVAKLKASLAALREAVQPVKFWIDHGFIIGAQPLDEQWDALARAMEEEAR